MSKEKPNTYIAEFRASACIHSHRQVIETLLGFVRREKHAVLFSAALQS